MKAVFDAEPWALNDRPKDPAFKIADLPDQMPMGMWLRRIVTENSIGDHLDWREREVTASYCLDAPDIAPNGVMKVVVVPKDRHDPIQLQSDHCLIRPPEYMVK